MKSMLLVTSSWNGIPSFKMFPVSIECPFAEVIHVPQGGLAIISKLEYEKFSMVPVLDSNGERVPVKKGKANRVEYKEERKLFRTLYEYQIVNREEIESFILRFGINSDEFDYKKHLDYKIEVKTSDPELKAINEGPQLSKVED